MKGRIVKQISNDYTVECQNLLYVCKARGKFRKEGVTPLVGDFVEFDDLNNYITMVLPRKNELLRPSIANVDIAVVVASVKMPDFDSKLLDKLLAIITFNNIKPVIVFSKLDLLAPTELDKFNVYYDYYKKFYDTFINTDINSIKKVLKGSVSVVTGQSGAGKSSLLNRLCANLNLKTNEISKALNRGKHTTRHTSLIKIDDFMIADTPGFSALSFSDMSKSDIRDSFPEFNKYRIDCKYRDCMHQNENDCRIKQLVNEGVILKSRYENYISFIGDK